MIRICISKRGRLQTVQGSCPWKGIVRCLATDDPNEKNDLYSSTVVTSMVGHSFPDFIEWWNRDSFRKIGYGLVATTAACATAPMILGGALTVASAIPAAVVGTLTAGYWYVGLRDIRQKSHAIRRNYPVLGNMRYVLETVRAHKACNPWEMIVEES
jgi:hypothetical protein